MGLANRHAVLGTRHHPRAWFVSAGLAVLALFAVAILVTPSLGTNHWVAHGGVVFPAPTKATSTIT